MHNILYIVRNLCSIHGITVAELERKLGFASGTIQRWDKVDPSISKIKTVADYFNISVDYLLDRTKIPELTEQAISDPEMVKIHRLSSVLSKRDRKKMMSILEAAFIEDFPNDEEDSEKNDISE